MDKQPLIRQLLWTGIDKVSYCVAYVPFYSSSLSLKSPFYKNSYATYLWYFLSACFVVFLRQIRNQITYLWQSKWQRVQVHSSMNTASKASNLFEAFFGIHEMLPWQNWTEKTKKLHVHVFKSNIGKSLLYTVSE